MNTLLFFRGISALLFCILVSCNAGKKEPPADLASQLKHSGYDDRIDNIFSYIGESKFNISFADCNNLIILQTNLCNSCNKEKLNAIFDSLEKTSEPIYFILADNNAAVIKQIKDFNKNSGVFIDTLHLLPKYNLSFVRNIRVNTCKGKIKKWSFI